MIFNEKLTMANGAAIPKLALGTWMIDDDKAAEAVRSAIETGYRHIDSAQAYGNERGVGEGISASGLPRDRIFVTSKVAAELKDYKSASESIDRSLLTSGLDYLDLMLIHCPQPWSEYNRSENRYIEGNREVWRALEEAYKAGKLRAIGVSNFLQCDIESICETASVKPMINQIMTHIANTPRELIRYCQENGIIVEAYSPIAHGRALGDPMIKKFAEKYGVTVPQLCIRYAWQLDLVVLPKTTSPERMKENAAIDFVISDEDMEYLKSL